MPPLVGLRRQFTSLLRAFYLPCCKAHAPSFHRFVSTCLVNSRQPLLFQKQGQEWVTPEVFRMESQETHEQEQQFSGHIASADALYASPCHVSPAALSTLLSIREPSFLDTAIWHSKASGPSQRTHAPSKDRATLPAPVSPQTRRIIAPPTTAAITRYKLTLGDSDGMFDPVRVYNEVAQRMKQSIARALAPSLPSPRRAKSPSKPSPAPSPITSDLKQKLWIALPALPRLFSDMQRSAGGMGRSADIGASHWLAWCSDQEALGRVPHVTRAVGLEALITTGCQGSFKLSLEHFCQCVLVLALRVHELESAPQPPPSSSERSSQVTAIDSSTTESYPSSAPSAPAPPSAPKPRARACSSLHIAICKTFLKRLATAIPPSPPVHERSRRSCKSSPWFGKVPAVDKLFNQLHRAPFSRAAFVSAVLAAFGDAAACSEDLLAFAFDWAANICNGHVVGEEAMLDYDGLWQAVLYACGHCNSSSAPPIRCSSSALRDVQAWSSAWTFAAQRSPSPRAVVLPDVTAARPSATTYASGTASGTARLKSSIAAVSNYESILGGVDSNHAEKLHAEREESDYELAPPSVSFAAQPLPTATRNLSPTRLPSSRSDRTAAADSRPGSRSVAAHHDVSRPVTGIGGFSLPTVKERLRNSPIRQHGTASLVSGVVKSPGPNPLLKQPHPVLDKTFAGRVHQASFTFQPEFSSRRVFGHFVCRDVVLGPVPRYLMNVPASAEKSFILQASPPRRYPEGKNINPEWACKLDVNDELFDKSLKGHEV